MDREQTPRGIDNRSAYSCYIAKQGITQKAFAEAMGMNPRHLTAVKSSERRNRTYNELGAIKLACLWALDRFKGA